MLRIRFKAEKEFVNNFFGHDRWLYEPATFKTDLFRYTPDFYDPDTNIFIEVVGSRQAYHANKPKYKLFRKAFPKIRFEVRGSDGSLWSKPKSRRSKPLKIKLITIKCLRCGYTWVPRQKTVLRCAKCRSAYWATPRKEGE